MISPMFPSIRAINQYWLQTVTSMVWSQWKAVGASLRAAQTVLTSAALAPPAEVGPARPSSASVADAAEEMISRARDRTRKGLAPPRELYQAPYRDRIDWGQFPEWARPSDPDLFEGSTHEG
jgi:hypothetical protein